MAVQVENLKRVFKHKDIVLEDPSEGMSKEDVLDFYSNQYPELTTANVVGPKIENDSMVFEFITIVGTKG